MIPSPVQVPPAISSSHSQRSKYHHLPPTRRFHNIPSSPVPGPSQIPPTARGPSPSPPSLFKTSNIAPPFPFSLHHTKTRDECQLHSSFSSRGPVSRAMLRCSGMFYALPIRGQLEWFLILCVVWWRRDCGVDACFVRKVVVGNRSLGAVLGRATLNLGPSGGSFVWRHDLGPANSSARGLGGILGFLVSTCWGLITHW